MVFGYIGLGNRVFHLMTYQVFGTMMDTVLAAVAMFTFMGYILESAGLMNRLFHAVQLLFGRIHGSLYLATIFTATLFAAATGIVGASVTIIALMAAPAMLRSKYDVRMSAGTICAGGTLGILIPPERDAGRDGADAAGVGRAPLRRRAPARASSSPSCTSCTRWAA
jgi:TRAP-type mannitol/chloroaromatic compound transport system permease large subunit